MNKQQRQELEDMVRQLAEEPYNPSEKHIEEIKQRAFEEYEQIMAAKQKMKEKRKGTLRRVVVTAAAIVCLLVGSTVIALLNPLQSGDADNFFRRAVIWVNDQLHLGIELPFAKNPESSAKFDEGTVMSSISEVAKTVDFPIVYFKETSQLHFDFIEKEAVPYSNEIYITLEYGTSEGTIKIVHQFGADYISATAKFDNSTTVETPIGKIVVIETMKFTRAVFSIDDVYVTIIGNMPEKIFLGYCQNLNLFN